MVLVLIGKIKKVGVREETRTEKELKENFDRIFSLSIQYLEDWEKEYLILFLLLPTNTDIPVEILYQAGDKEKIKEFINDLAKKSLIRKEIETDKSGLKESVITHDLFKEYLRNIYLKEGHKILNLQKEEFYKRVFNIAKDFIKGLTKEYLEEASKDDHESAILWSSGKIKILESIGNDLIDLKDFKELFLTKEVMKYLAKLGASFFYINYLEEGINLQNNAIEIGKKIYILNSPEIDYSYNELGLLYHKKGVYDKAEKYYKKALEIRKKICKDKDYSNLAISYNNLGSLYHDKKVYDKAEDYYKKALEILEKIQKYKKHRYLATSYNNLGLLYKAKGKYEKAEDYYKKTLEIYEKIYKDKNHPDLATSYNNLGSLYHDKGEYDKAKKYFRKAEEVMRRFREKNKH